MTHRKASGFTLVEILVAVVILALVLLLLNPVVMRVFRLSGQLTTTSQRMGTLSSTLNRLQSQPYSAIAVGSSCTTVPGTPYGYTECVQVTALTALTKRVRVIVTPAAALGIRPDTSSFDVTRAGSASP